MSLTVETESAGFGHRLTFHEAGRPCSFEALFQRLVDRPGARDALLDALRAVPFEAYAWEHPPLTRGTMQDPAESVCVASPALARRVADPGAFEAHFDSRPVAEFLNLGGDARLIAPAPGAGSAHAAHLASFVRGAPRDAVHALFEATARMVLREVAESPRWLSTAGLGVPWLHVRWDRRPKYYRHGPYAG